VLSNCYTSLVSYNRTSGIVKQHQSLHGYNHDRSKLNADLLKGAKLKINVKETVSSGNLI